MRFSLRNKQALTIAALAVLAPLTRASDWGVTWGDVFEALEILPNPDSRFSPPVESEQKQIATRPARLMENMSCSDAID